jgi:hypothetical protein
MLVGVPSGLYSAHTTDHTISEPLLSKEGLILLAHLKMLAKLKIACPTRDHISGLFAHLRIGVSQHAFRCLPAHTRIRH